MGLLEAQGWPQVTGTITYSGQHSRTERRWRQDRTSGVSVHRTVRIGSPEEVRFEYQVDGRTFQADTPLFFQRLRWTAVALRPFLVPQAGEEARAGKEAAARTERMKQRTPRVDWAELLRRTFDFDVFACVRCGGRRRVLAHVKGARGVRALLKHLGLATSGARLAPARGPPQAAWC